MSLLQKMNNSLSGRAFIYTVGNFVLGASNFLASAIFVRMMSTSDYGLASARLANNWPSDRRNDSKCEADVRKREFKGLLLVDPVP